MTIKKGKPFLAWILSVFFPLILDDKTIMVWGDTIYTEYALPPHLLEHEKVHIRQQKDKLRGLIWWFRFTVSKKFRLEQEIEAFKVQYKTLGGKDSLYNIAMHLSGPLYGNMISFDEATKRIIW